MTTYTYDFEQNPAQNYGKVVSVTHPGPNSSAMVTDTTTYNYTYDPTYDVNGNPGSYQAVSCGLPLTVTDNDGRTTHYRYDARGNVLIVIDSDGRRTDNTYNLTDQLTSTHHRLRPLVARIRSLQTMEYVYPDGPCCGKQITMRKHRPYSSARLSPLSM